MEQLRVSQIPFQQLSKSFGEREREKKKSEILLLSAEQKHLLLPPSTTTENTYLVLHKCDRKDIFLLSDFISIKTKSLSGEGSDLNGPLKVCWLT